MISKDDFESLSGSFPEGKNVSRDTPRTLGISQGRKMIRVKFVTSQSSEEAAWRVPTLWGGSIFALRPPLRAQAAHASSKSVL